MSTSTARTAVLAATAGLLLAAAGCADKPDDAPATAGGLQTVKVFTSAPSFGNLVSLTMQTEQTDTSFGIKQDLTTAGSSSPVLVAGIMSGQYNFAGLAPPPSSTPFSRGSDLMIMCGANVGAQTLIVRNDKIKATGVSATAPIDQKIKALKGMTIVTSAPGSGNYALLDAVLRAYGLDPAKDVKMVPQLPCGAESTADGSVGKPGLSLSQFGEHVLDAAGVNDRQRLGPDGRLSGLGLVGCEDLP